MVKVRLSGGIEFETSTLKSYDGKFSTHQDDWKFDVLYQTLSGSSSLSLIICMYLSLPQTLAVSTYFKYNIHNDIVVFVIKLKKGIWT